MTTAFLEYSDREHAYYVDGRELPSVTTILDRAGLISRFCKDDLAAARGTEVHRLCAKYDTDRGHLSRSQIKGVNNEK